MPNTDDRSGWLQLLSSLSDDELRRYGQIAADQRRLEWQYAWAQAALVIGSVAAMGWFIAECMAHGLTWGAVAALGLAAVLGYWPYRRAIVRRLWERHCKAVAREQADRKTKTGADDFARNNRGMD